MSKLTQRMRDIAYGSESVLVQATLREAADALEAVAKDADKLRPVLTELVACKDLKDRLGYAVGATGGFSDGMSWREADFDYVCRKPLAWEAARALLATYTTPGTGPNVRHERRAKGREAAFGTSARWRG